MPGVSPWAQLVSFVGIAPEPATSIGGLVQYLGCRSPVAISPTPKTQRPPGVGVGWLAIFCWQENRFSQNPIQVLGFYGAARFHTFNFLFFLPIERWLPKFFSGCYYLQPVSKLDGLAYVA